MLTGAPTALARGRCTFSEAVGVLAACAVLIAAAVLA